MSIGKLNRVIPVILMIAAVSSDAPGDFDIETSGSVSPLHAADGDWRVADASGDDAALYIGEVFLESGAVDVTNGATLTTPKRVWMGYSVGATAVVNVTGSAWIAEDHVGLGNAGSTQAEINITQGTWRVEDSCYIAAGSDSEGEVNLYDGAEWTSEDGVHVGDRGAGEVNIDPGASWISREQVNVGFHLYSAGAVNLRGGDWTSQATLRVGKLDLFGEYSEGAVHVNADSELTCLGLLDVTPGGEVILDGGVLHLAGGATFDGDLSVVAGGGTVRIEVGSAIPDEDLSTLGSGVSFVGCVLDVIFDPNFTPSRSDSFNLFDPAGGVDLEAVLTAVSAITTPDNWELDLTTGVLSCTVQSVDGDADGDMDVDADDLAILKAQFGGPLLPGSDDPDFDNDGVVALTDFAIMRANWGAGVGTASEAPGVIRAPEPATMILMGACLPVLLKRKPKT